MSTTKGEPWRADLNAELAKRGIVYTPWKGARTEPTAARCATGCGRGVHHAGLKCWRCKQPTPALRPAKKVGARPGKLIARLRRVEPSPLAVAAVGWLRSEIGDKRLRPDGVVILEQLFTLAPQHLTSADVWAALNAPETSTRFWFARGSLPAPARWFLLARALHAANLFQTDPNATLATVAAALGYAEYTSSAILVKRVFGVTPTQIRARPGWEWLLDRWMDRTMKKRPGRKAA